VRRTCVARVKIDSCRCAELVGNVSVDMRSGAWNSVRIIIM